MAQITQEVTSKVMTDISVEQYNEMVEKIEALTQLTHRSRQEQQSQKVQIGDQQVHIDSQQKQIDEHETIFNEGGLVKKVRVKKGFAELQNRNLILFEDCKSLSWTTLNYFSSYRELSTNLQQGNFETEETLEQQITIAGSGKLISYAKDLSKGLPVLGGVLSVIDDFVNTVYQASKERNFNDKVNALKRVFMLNRDPNMVFQEDLSLVLAILALRITNHKAEDIISPKEHQNEKLEKTKEWLDQQLKKVENMVLGEGVDLSDSSASSQAFADAVLLISYIVKNYKAILNNQDDPLEDQFFNVFATGKTEKLLQDSVREFSAPELSNDQEKKSDCKCF